MFSCGFCEILKNTFFKKLLRKTASELQKASKSYKEKN